MCFAFSINILFLVTVIFSEGKFCSLCEYSLCSTTCRICDEYCRTHKCGKNESLFVNVVVWFFLVLYWVKLKTMSCHVGKGV